jgi:hypothetical protein
VSHRLILDVSSLMYRAMRPDAQQRPDAHQLGRSNLEPDRVLRMSDDAGRAAAPQSASKEGSITIRYAYREKSDEFEWSYEPDPPIPDELAQRLLREVAERL